MYFYGQKRTSEEEIFWQHKCLHRQERNPVSVKQASASSSWLLAGDHWTKGDLKRACQSCIMQCVWEKMCTHLGLNPSHCSLDEAEVYLSYKQTIVCTSVHTLLEALDQEEEKSKKRCSSQHSAFWLRSHCFPAICWLDFPYFLISLWLS